MKSLLNKGIHQLWKLVHKQVVCSDVEKLAFLERAKEVKSEISDWCGTTEHENIGLGQNCNASWYLKSTGIKRASYPFDWVFATPAIIMDILNDDFKAFLDKDQLIPHGMDAGHKRYHETMFGHRNPASSASDLQFLERCVARWKQLMHDRKPVVFITVVLNEFEKRKRWQDGFTKGFAMPKNQVLSDFEGMMQQIKDLNPNAKFLFIEQYTEKPFELSITEKSGSVLWIKFCSIDKNTGVQYINEVDDSVMKVLYEGLTPN